MALMVSSILTATLLVSYASDCASANVTLYVSNSEDSSIVPFADVIVYKYRLLNGKQQYRRWNETRGYWIDPYWIDL